MCPEAIVAYRRKPDEGEDQDAALRLSPTGTGGGEEDGAACICADAAVGV